MSYDDPESENNGTFVVNESKDILMNSWRTELNAPEILPYKEELVAEIQEFLSDQEVTDFEMFTPTTLSIIQHDDIK
jgi:hypothetical protein